MKAYTSGASRVVVTSQRTSRTKKTRASPSPGDGPFRVCELSFSFGEKACGTLVLGSFLLYPGQKTVGMLSISRFLLQLSCLLRFIIPWSELLLSGQIICIDTYLSLLPRQFQLIGSTRNQLFSQFQFKDSVHNQWSGQFQ